MASGRIIHWKRLARLSLAYAWLTMLALADYFAYRNRPSRRSGFDRPELRFFLWLMAALVLAALLFWAVRALKRHAVATGPAVAAIVKSTTVREDQRSLVQRYLLVIGYKYYLQDEPYWGFGRRVFRDEPAAEAAAAELLGREVTVHYHPRNPDLSQLA
jgi:hypothetical protein